MGTWIFGPGIPWSGLFGLGTPGLGTPGLGIPGLGTPSQGTPSLGTPWFPGTHSLGYPLVFSPLS